MDDEKATKVNLLRSLFDSTSTQSALGNLAWIESPPRGKKAKVEYRKKLILFADAIGSRREYALRYDEQHQSIKPFDEGDGTRLICRPGALWIQLRAESMIRSFFKAKTHLKAQRIEVVRRFKSTMATLYDPSAMELILEELDPFNISVSADSSLFSKDITFLDRTVLAGVLIENDAKIPRCSGVVVDPSGWILTNSHCIMNERLDLLQGTDEDELGDLEPEECENTVPRKIITEDEVEDWSVRYNLGRDNDNPDKLRVGVWKLVIYSDGRWGITECVFSDSVYDYAVLKPVHVSGSGALNYNDAFRIPKRSDPVAILGNPAQKWEDGQPIPTRPSLQYSAPAAVLALVNFTKRGLKKHIHKAIEAGEPVASTLVHNGYTMAGMSGAPLFNRFGELVGLHNDWIANGEWTPASGGVSMKYMKTTLTKLLPKTRVRTQFLLKCVICEESARLICTCTRVHYCFQCSETQWPTHADQCDG